MIKKIVFASVCSLTLHSYAHSAEELLAISSSITPVLMPVLTNQMAEQSAVDTEWQALLYYPKSDASKNQSKHSLKSNLKKTSEVDDLAFFIAPNGKSSAVDELKATYAGLFAEASLGDQHIQCKYPARTDFMRRKVLPMMGVHASQLPKPVCTAYEKWLQEFPVDALTLLFPSADITSPASMFGHVFLRLEQKNQANTPVLMSSLNYGAITPADFSVPEYMYKGLVGGYPGKYTLQPYYVKIKEYVSQENRDIWEYPLTLTDAEMTQFKRHLYEMHTFYYDYFYLDENCAYRIITLLEAIRPELNISQHFQGVGIPSDIVYRLKEAGLLGEARYRASALETFYQHLDQLSLADQKIVLKLKTIDASQLSEAVAKIPPKNRASILEVLHEYSQIIANQNKVPDRVLNKRIIRALVERSKLNDIPPLPKVIPPKYRPDEGHFPALIKLGLGESDQTRFLDIGYRRLNHAFTDPSAGYFAGNELVALDLNARLEQPISKQGEHESVKLTLNSLDLLRIKAIRPVNLFFQPLSWQVRLGGNRCQFSSSTQHKASWQNAIETGVGYSLGTIQSTADWQFQAGMFGMVKLQDQSCLAEANQGTSQYLTVFPKLEVIANHRYLSAQYSASLEQQGRILNQEAKLFVNKNTFWNIGLKYNHTTLNERVPADQHNFATLGVYLQYYLH